MGNNPERTWYAGSLCLGTVAFALLMAACSGGGGSSTPPAQTAPAITTQPQSETVTAPATATFAVTCTGNPVPTYQWYVGITAIPNATLASYTTPATTTSMNGNSYTVIATNSMGSVSSNPASLTVNPTTPTAPTFTTQPANQTVQVGATATFMAAASGNPAPTYQWYQGITAIPNATSASYTTPAATTSMNGNSYTVVATNSMGSVTSNPASLTVNATPTAPIFTTQPQSQHVTAPATATFTAAASGNPTPTYQWYLGITAIPNATSASYTTPATTTGMNGNSYTVIATNSVGSVTSNPASLTVNPAVSSMEGIYCGTIIVSGAAKPMIAGVTAIGEFRFTTTDDWVGSATLSGTTGGGTLYTARGATPNTLSLSNVVVTPGTSITGSYAYGSATGTFSLASATDPKTGVVLYNNPTMALPVTGWTTTTTDNLGWQSNTYPWTAVNVDASGIISMTVNKANVTGTLAQLSSGVNLYRINLTFANSGTFTGLGWYSGLTYSGPANGSGWPLNLGNGADGFFPLVFYCILSTTPDNKTSNLGVAAAVSYAH